MRKTTEGLRAYVDLMDRIIMNEDLHKKYASQLPEIDRIAALIDSGNYEVRHDKSVRYSVYSEGKVIEDLCLLKFNGYYVGQYDIEFSSSETTEGCLREFREWIPTFKRPIELNMKHIESELVELWKEHDEKFGE